MNRVVWNDTYVLIAAQPDFDQEWFEGLNIEQDAKISDEEETKALEELKIVRIVSVVVPALLVRWW